MTMATNTSDATVNGTAAAPTKATPSPSPSSSFLPPSCSASSSTSAPVSLSTQWRPKRSIAECDAILSAPGKLHELEHAVVGGRVMRVYKHLWPVRRSVNYIVSFSSLLTINCMYSFFLSLFWLVMVMLTGLYPVFTPAVEWTSIDTRLILGRRLRINK